MEHELNERFQNLAEKMKNEASGGATPTGMEVTVREFIHWFGYAKRGNRVVNDIRDQLDKFSLRTVPDFEHEYIDGTIKIELDAEATDVGWEPPDPTVRIGMLPTAHRPPTSVRPNDSITTATTVMLLKDFSQLPVMVNERDVKGVVSWRSIGTTFALGRESNEVRNCMEPHREIGVGAPFLDAIRDIWDHGYVLVRNNDRKISGIVTASDFADQFAQLARPFLIIGEIELHLRKLISKFTLQEMAEVSKDGGKKIEGSADLSFGDYCRLLEHPDRWDRLSLMVDRTTFMAHLNSVRALRNDVVHFAPDGIESADIEKLEYFAMFLRRLGHQ